MKDNVENLEELMGGMEFEIPEMYNETEDMMMGSMLIDPYGMLTDLYNKWVYYIRKTILDVNDIAVREYERKESLAFEATANGDYSVFEESAKAYDMTPEDFCKLILDKAKEYRRKEDEALLKIGILRSKITKLIETDKEKSIELMETYNALPIEDVLKIDVTKKGK